MMKCPRCSNTKTFRHYAIAELEAIIDYDEDGEATDRDHDEEAVISGTTMMRCDECEFVCLPEVFGNGEPDDWPEPYRDNGTGWFITQGTDVALYGVTIVGGRGYLDDKVGESYSQLFQIHTCNSLAKLPQFLASELPEIKNSAIEKMRELQC